MANRLDAAGLHRIVTEAPQNFGNFPLLFTVPVAMIDVAEASGFLSALLAGLRLPHRVPCWRQPWCSRQ